MRSASFASLAYENKKKKTRHERFLKEMEKNRPFMVIKHIPVKKRKKSMKPGESSGA